MDNGSSSSNLSPSNPPPVSPPPLDRATLLSLVNASRVILSPLDLQERFQRISEQAAEVLDAQGASVLILDSTRNELVFEAVTGPGADVLLGERFPADLGIAGEALRTGRVIRVDDVTQNAKFFPGIDRKTKLKTSSIMAAPLIHDEEIIGVLEVVNPLGRPRFEPRDVEMLELFANLVAAAARNGQALDRVSREYRSLRQALPVPQIIGESSVLSAAMRLCRKVAATTSTVLLYGETGTGKELAARAIHDWSPRVDKPFIAINCAALAESLLESELFGHEKGAFTGAMTQKPGRFELAEGGTLFLDEVGEMSLATQVKLLRVLQERQFTRVGGTRTVSCDVRLIAATNRDLQTEMDNGRFRADLFFRLNVFPVTMPPLRQRIEDLPALVEHFTAQLAPSLGISPPRVSPEAMDRLARYPWPGNVRELRNVVERCSLIAEENCIQEHDLPAEFLRDRTNTSAPASAQNTVNHSVSSHSHHSPHSSRPAAVAQPHSPAVAAAAPHESPIESRSGMADVLADKERGMMIEALRAAGWNQSAAARTLGISRDNLRYRIAKYQIRKPDDSPSA
jgi:Nif-specific regulatory protein